MKRVFNFPSFIIIVIISLLFSYIILDYTIFKPNYEKIVENVKKDHDSLARYLDLKIPQIDSTLKTQTNELLDQKNQIKELNELFSKFRK